ncbi:PepSY domain-containing protein [Bacillus horti]|uniref:Small secreted protein n=1 Tax=Caldalkalibacillus horti TaxID=77523 RepID=A0ABT9VX50_9BACI|nr:PepSY domain-containing protein [Bacillus horti]MDQ0165454.1 putative small secreted protein [Bacillus horti]
MKLGRFLLGVAAGLAVSYVVIKSSETKFVKPEKALAQIKKKYKDKMSIMGSWIQIEPIAEEFNGLTYNIYQGGLTTLKDGNPHYIDFKVDADTGTILELQS